MKKIAVLLLLVLALTGCGKKASGIFTVQNNSSHTVTFGIGQDYKVEKYSIESGGVKDIPWKQYVLFWTVSPKNIISYTESSNKAVIKNNTKTYKYQVRNLITTVTLLDNNQNILCRNNKKVDSITISERDQEIECFIPLTYQSIILAKGEPFDIDGKSYTPIEKTGNSYYLNEEKDGKIKTSKINITIENNLIVIYK